MRCVMINGSGGRYCVVMVRREERDKERRKVIRIFVTNYIVLIVNERLLACFLNLASYKTREYEIHSATSNRIYWQVVIILCTRAAMEAPYSSLCLRIPPGSSLGHGFFCYFVATHE